MTASKARMRTLYKRLSSLGFPRPYVTNFALPEWWDDLAGENAAGFSECAVLLSRHLGIDLRTIQDDSQDLSIAGMEHVKFKKTKDKATGDLHIASSIALRVATLVVTATSQEFKAPPSNPDEIRSEILSDGAKWVGLSQLVDYCWAKGIPVIHLSQFPKGARKMDGMAAMVNGRPVILLSRKAKTSGHLLFILAHELGHICLNHLPTNGILVDEDMASSNTDNEEDAADGFAIHLLNGEAGSRFMCSGRWPNALRLADLATKTGTERQIDPAHIVLNYAHSMGQKFYPVGNAALKILEPNARPIDMINSRVAKQLNWDEIPEVSSEFLSRVMF